jgi:hypothetical protein
MLLLASYLLLAEVQAEDQKDTLFQCHFESAASTEAAGLKLAGPAEFTAGVSGMALVFQPKTAATVSAQKALNPGQGTIELWVRPNWDGNDGLAHCFFESAPASEDQPFRNVLRIAKTEAGAIEFIVYDDRNTDKSPENPSHKASSASAAEWKAKDWHYLVAVWDTKTLTRVYVDGKAGASFPENLPLGNVGGRLYVGNARSGKSPADATLDEMRILSVPLSAEEIRRRYERLKPSAPPPGLDEALKAAAVIHIRTSAPGHYCYLGDELELAIEVTAREAAEQPEAIEPTAAERKLRYSVTDFYGKTLEEGSAALKFTYLLDAQAVSIDRLEPFSKKLALKPPTRGINYVNVRLVDGNRTLKVRSSSFAVLPPQPGPLEFDDISPFGVVMGLGGDDKHLAILERIGVRWAEIPFPWCWQEMNRGKISLQASEKTQDAYDRHHIRVMASIVGTPRWAAFPENGGAELQHTYGSWETTPPSDPALLATFTREAARKFKGRIKHWQYGNEMHLEWAWHGKGATQEYLIECLKAFRQAVKEADPEAQVHLGGTALNHWHTFYDKDGDVWDPTFEKYRQMNALQFLDVFNIHNNLIAEVSIENSRIKGTLAKYGHPRPVWDCETHAGYRWKDKEGAQAGRRVAEDVGALARGIDRIFWFAGWTANYKSAEEEYTAQTPVRYDGILQDDLAPTPALVAYAVEIWQLAGAKPVRELDLGGAFRAFEFVRNDRPLTVLWSRKGDGLPLTLHADSNEVRTVDLMGNERTEVCPEGLLSLTLDHEMPLYVHAKLRPEAVAELLVRPRFTSLSQSPELVVSVRNIGDRPLEGVLKVNPRASWATEPAERRFDAVERGKAAEWAFPIGRGTLFLDELASVEVRLETKRHTQATTAQVSLLPVPRALRTPTIDGDLSEWPRQAVPLPLSLGEEVAAGKRNDLVSTSRMLWNDACVYFGAEVLDSTFFQRDSGGNTWKGDSIQVAFTPLDADPKKLDYSIVNLALTPNGPEVWRVHCVETPGSGPQAALAGAKLAVKRLDDRLLYEAALPVAELLGKTPQPGDSVKFSLLVNDADLSGKRRWAGWAGGLADCQGPRLFAAIHFVQSLETAVATPNTPPTPSVATEAVQTRGIGFDDAEAFLLDGLEVKDGWLVCPKSPERPDEAYLRMEAREFEANFGADLSEGYVDFGNRPGNKIWRKVTLRRDAEYHLWARVFWGFNEANRMAFAVDDPEMKAGRLSSRWARAFHWLRASEPLKLAAGEHTLYFGMFEKDHWTRIDRALLTTDADFRPRGGIATLKSSLRQDVDRWLRLGILGVGGGGGVETLYELAESAGSFLAIPGGNDLTQAEVMRKPMSPAGLRPAFVLGGESELAAPALYKVNCASLLPADAAAGPVLLDDFELGMRSGAWELTSPVQQRLYHRGFETTVKSDVKMVIKPGELEETPPEAEEIAFRVAFGFLTKDAADGEWALKVAYRQAPAGAKLSMHNPFIYHHGWRNGRAVEFAARAVAGRDIKVALGLKAQGGTWSSPPQALELGRTWRRYRVPIGETAATLGYVYWLSLDVTCGPGDGELHLDTVKVTP